MRALVTLEGGRMYEFERVEEGIKFHSIDNIGRASRENEAIIAALPRLKPGSPLVVGFITGVVGNYGIVAGVRYSS